MSTRLRRNPVSHEVLRLVVALRRLERLGADVAMVPSKNAVVVRLGWTVDKAQSV
ncbi:MAG: hypothetical protein WA988_01350 [Candidatus Nanopelagicales bacterium]